MAENTEGAQQVHDNTTPETPSPQWTPEYAARTLFLSFRFSQGDSNSQGMLYEYLHHIRPDWKMNDESFKDKALNHAQTLAEKFVQPKTETKEKNPLPRRHTPNMSGEPITRGKVTDAITEELSSMAKDFDEPMQQDKKEIVTEVTRGIMRRDKKYVIEGRPREAHNQSKVKSDPFSSFVIDFGMRGAKTGLAEFDEMFRDIKDHIATERSEQTEEWTRDIEPDLTTIITHYNLHHPDNPFSFEEDKKV